MDETRARTIIADALGQVAPEVDPSTIDPDAELQLEYDLDSMDFLNLVERVSSAIGRDIPEHDYPQLITLSQFAAYVAGSATSEAS
jgi:acyl carrier protein